MKRKSKLIGIATFLLFAFAAIYMFGQYDGRAGNESLFVKKALAAEKKSLISPVKARGRDFYAPNSEDLGPDEMRLDCLWHRHAHGASETSGLVLAARTGQR